MLRKVFFSILILVAVIGISQAAVPGQINYQGILKDSSGRTLSGNYQMTFAIYSSTTGGSALWSETQTAVVDSGLYNIQLGAGTAISPSVFDGTTRYLGVKVGSDSEMTPRIPMITVPYAFQAANADIATTANNALNANTLAGHSAALTGGGVIPFTDSGGKLNSSVIPSTGGGGNSVTLGPTSAQQVTIGNAIWVESSDSLGSGIFARATGTGSNVGGSFNSAGSSGMGVYGKATHTTGTNYGVYGETLSPTNGWAGYFTGGRGLYATKLTIPSLASSGQPANVYWDQAAGGVFRLGTGGGGVGNYVTLGPSVIDQTTSQRAIWVVSGNANGTGVEGDASSYGGYFGASGTTGKGVYGIATDSGASANIGGEFTAGGTLGKGVYGYTTNGSGTNYGGYFESAGSTGTGVYGKANSTSGPNIGGSFEASGVGGIGVRGISTASTGQGNYGGYFVSASEAGTGIYTKGAYCGIYGKATNTTGTCYGGEFSSSSPSGRGVYGIAGGVGAGDGVAGQSTSGRGVYGNSTSGVGVYGIGGNEGGHFEATGTNSKGVYGKSTGTNGYGVWGEGGATNYAGYFNGGRGVYISSILKLEPSSTPSSPTNGEIYTDGTHIYCYLSGWKQLDP